MLCKAVWYYVSFDLKGNMSRGKFTVFIYIKGVLQYTTTHLQVLFSLQYLGRITKVSQ